MQRAACVPVIYRHRCAHTRIDGEGEGESQRPRARLHRHFLFLILCACLSSFFYCSTARNERHMHCPFSSTVLGDMYGRTTNNAGTAQYIPQYSQYPTPGGAMMNPRSPAPTANPYRPPYPSGSPYQNGIASPSATAPGKGAARPQQVSPKRSTSQPTTPPQQQARYPTPYPGYSNGPVGYKPAGSNGYAPVPQQQQQQPPSWPPATGQRDATTPSLASSTGDSDSNSSNASQQTMSYPPSSMSNGPTTAAYGQMPSTPYNPGTMNDSSNNNNHMNASGHPYGDQAYGNHPPPNYGYPPQQQMNPYGNHPPGMHGPSPNDFRPPPVQTMDDENNVYRNRPPSGLIMDPQQQQQQHPPPPPLSQSHSVSSSTNGPKSPSGTSMSSYVPDDADSSNSSFGDSPPPSHEKGKRKLSSTTSNTHGTPAEVFTKLREMGDESERAERHVFVDRLQKLWEEHQIVCRNLPSISKQTIDLYRLYTCVREQNGFQEFSKVAKNRHWRDIASKLNIPNSSSAAFNVKQKYINLKLFHYECKFDRGGINPEPILADIEKQQGKRAKTPKKGANSTGVTNNANSNDGSNDGKSNSSLPPPSNAPPANSIPQPPQQQQQPMPDPYRGYPPHPMGHPQQGYRPMPMHPYGSAGNEMQPPYDPSTGGQMMYNNPEMDYQRAGYPQPPAMMKPPGNAYGMPPPPPSQVQQPAGPMGAQHRPAGPYPSIASKPQQQQMVPPSPAEYNGQPTAAAAPPPPVPSAPQQTYHYPAQQPMPSGYPPSGAYPPQQRTAMMPGGAAPQSHDPYLSQQVPPNQTYTNSSPVNYPYKKVENAGGEVDNQDPHKGNKLLMNQLRAPASSTSMLPSSSPISILTSSSSPLGNATVTPSSTHFPANSVEATSIPSKIKRKKLTAKDVSRYSPSSSSQIYISHHSSSCRSLETDDVSPRWFTRGDHLGLGHDQCHAR